jgi:homoserine dehydrogenase
VLGDVVSVMSSPGMELDPIEQPRFLPEVEVESAFYLHLEVEDAPGVLAQVARVLGDNEVSVKSVVQKGHRRERAPRDGHAPGCRGAVPARSRSCRGLAPLRSRPRSIRVIEEEFQS